MWFLIIKDIKPDRLPSCIAIYKWVDCRQFEKVDGASCQAPNHSAPYQERMLDKFGAVGSAGANFMQINLCHSIVAQFH